MSARRSLGGHLVDNSAHAGNEFGEREVPLVDASAREAVRFAVTHPAAPIRETLLVWSRPVVAIAFKITSERESEQSLASEFQQVRKFLAQRGGAGSEADNGEPATGVLKYLASVLHHVHPLSSMSLRNSGRFETTAECLDASHAGDFPHLEDLLVQRLNTVQTAVMEGNWNLARHLELTLATGNNVVAHAGMRAAQRTRLDQRPLQQGGSEGVLARVTP